MEAFLERRRITSPRRFDASSTPLSKPVGLDLRRSSALQNLRNPTEATQVNRVRIGAESCSLKSEMQSGGPISQLGNFKLPSRMVPGTGRSWKDEKIWS